MVLDKQKEILELRKLYLSQFEKHETKILIAWFGLILLPLFILWIEGRMDGILLFFIALFSCFLDIILQVWRKNSFNGLIKSIEEDKISTIKPEGNYVPIAMKNLQVIESKKIEPKENNAELMRLAIITLLVTAMFGILQYFGDKTFETIGADVILKTIALVLLKVPFLIFVIYVVLLGLNLRYEKRREFKRLKAFVYDLGIDMTIFIICFSLLFMGLVWLLIKFPAIPMNTIVGVMWVFIILVAIIFYREIMKHVGK